MHTKFRYKRYKLYCTIEPGNGQVTVCLFEEHSDFPSGERGNMKGGGKESREEATENRKIEDEQAWYNVSSIRIMRRTLLPQLL